MDLLRNLLLSHVLVSVDLVFAEYADQQIEGVEFLLADEAIRADFRAFFELVIEAVRLEDVRVVHILRAHEEDSDVSLAHLCLLNSLILRAQYAKPTKIIRPIHEHEEDLEDEALILVPPAHLDHEEEYAKVVEAESFLNLLLRQVLAGHPLVDLTAHDLSVHLI